MEVDDEADEGDGDPKDIPFPGPPPKLEKPDSFTLTFIDKDWIRRLARWADKNRITDVAFLELLTELVIMGGGKIEDITLSLSTIYRIREEERLHVEDDVNNAEYDDHVTCHFDGKRSKMGHLQGGEVKEHLPVIVSGVSGERQLGIQIAENSTGMKYKKSMFLFPTLSLSI